MRLILFSLLIGFAIGGLLDGIGGVERSKRIQDSQSDLKNAANEDSRPALLSGIGGIKEHKINPKIAADQSDPSFDDTDQNPNRNGQDLNNAGTDSSSDSSNFARVVSEPDIDVRDSRDSENVARDVSRPDIEDPSADSIDGLVLKSTDSSTSNDESDHKSVDGLVRKSLAGSEKNVDLDPTLQNSPEGRHSIKIQMEGSEGRSGNLEISSDKFGDTDNAGTDDNRRNSIPSSPIAAIPIPSVEDSLVASADAPDDNKGTVAEPALEELLREAAEVASKLRTELTEMETTGLLVRAERLRPAVARVWTAALFLRDTAAGTIGTKSIIGGGSGEGAGILGFSDSAMAKEDEAASAAKPGLARVEEKQVFNQGQQPAKGGQMDKESKEVEQSGDSRSGEKAPEEEEETRDESEKEPKKEKAGESRTKRSKEEEDGQSKETKNVEENDQNLGEKQAGDNEEQESKDEDSKSKEKEPKEEDLEEAGDNKESRTKRSKEEEDGHSKETKNVEENDQNLGEKQAVDNEEQEASTDESRQNGAGALAEGETARGSSALGGPKASAAPLEGGVIERRAHSGMDEGGGEAATRR